MGLASEMKNLSEELLASFKQRIIENEELVSEVQKTLDGFRHDHQEMTAVLDANAMALRQDLAIGEAARLGNYKRLMKNIHTSIKGISKEVKSIQKASNTMIGDYSQDRSKGAAEWNKMQETIAQLRKTGVVKPAKEVPVKAEKNKK